MEAENVVLLEWGALIPVLIIFAVIFIYKSVKVVPQQDAWVVERFGKFNAVLQPGLNFIIPLIDKIAYRHSLKEIPLDTSSQICITKDNTQLQVDGVLYFQVTNPELASYGTSDYVDGDYTASSNFFEKCYWHHVFG